MAGFIFSKGEVVKRGLINWFIYRFESLEL